MHTHLYPVGNGLEILYVDLRARILQIHLVIGLHDRRNRGAQQGAFARVVRGQIRRAGNEKTLGEQALVARADQPVAPMLRHLEEKIRRAKPGRKIQRQIEGQAQIKVVAALVITDRKPVSPPEPVRIFCARIVEMVSRAQRVPAPFRILHRMLAANNLVEIGPARRRHERTVGGNRRFDHHAPAKRTRRHERTGFLLRSVLHLRVQHRRYPPPVLHGKRASVQFDVLERFGLENGNETERVPGMVHGRAVQHIQVLIRRSAANQHAAVQFARLADARKVLEGLEKIRFPGKRGQSFEATNRFSKQARGRGGHRIVRPFVFHHNPASFKGQRSKRHDNRVRRFRNLLFSGRIPQERNLRRIRPRRQGRQREIPGVVRYPPDAQLGKVNMRAGQRFAGFPVPHESAQGPLAGSLFGGRAGSAHHHVLFAANALRFERDRAKNARKGRFHGGPFVRARRTATLDQRLGEHNIDASLVSHGKQRLAQRRFFRLDANGLPRRRERRQQQKGYDEQPAHAPRYRFPPGRDTVRALFAKAFRERRRPALENPRDCYFHSRIKTISRPART